MSEPLSAPKTAPKTAPISSLNNARFDGMAKIEECGLQGMISLRADLTARRPIAAATKAGGVKPPKQGQISGGCESGICWMSPDELLILCPYSEANDRLDALINGLGDTHALAVNVSDARCVFKVSGPPAREVLAKLCPVDMSPKAFAPGMFRRTRMAQVPAAFWMDKDESIYIICFRSVADYVFGLLKTTARPDTGVGVF